MNRLKNLWAWSAISPYEAGQDSGNAIVEMLSNSFGVKGNKSEIVFPVEDEPKTEIVSEADLDKALDQLITE